MSKVQKITLRSFWYVNVALLAIMSCMLLESDNNKAYAKEQRETGDVRHTDTQSLRLGTDILLSGIYFDSYLKGNPKPDQAIRLTNVDTKRAINVGGWRISDRYLIISRKGGGTKKKQSWKRSTRSSKSEQLLRRQPRRSKKSERRTTEDSDDTSDDTSEVSRTPGGSRAARYRDIVLPSGLKIPPGGSIWVTNQAVAFRQVFGRLPDVEAVNTHDEVANASLPFGWPYFFATQGIISLHNAYGETIDVVCYVRDSDRDTLDRRLVSQSHWRGPPIMLYKANAYSWTGQILARDRGITGLPIADTNTAQDWDNSFARTALGRDVTHRVERPGQSFWRFPALQNIPVEMIVTSAPENNFSAMVKVYEKARSELLINIYQWTSPELAKPVVAAAKRGVKVHVLMDGSPVGGVDDRSRHIARKLTRAGVRVYWMRGERKQRIHRRYRFNHAKYVIADRQWVVIGSENYGSTGHPIDPSYGNRGWEIQIRSQAFANQLRQVFMEDTDIKRFRDLVAYREESGFRWGPPQKTKPPKAAPQKGTYTYRRSPLYIRDRADLQLVLSPDNSLNEKDSLIGAILGCRQEVLVIQNSIPLYWGQKDRRSFEKTPNLALQAVIQAARKGCKVRVLIDSVWYNIQADNPRDNDDTVRMLNLIAHREQIDLQAKLVNLEAAGLSKIHTKGVIVDRRTTFIGSINWSENSFKGNREVGVIVTHPKVAMYYTDLFMRDWIRSRIFRVSITKHQAPVFIKPNALSKILRVYSVGDPVDVLAEVGDFYQVRLHERLIGYLRKSKHTHIFNSYEARFQIGRYGVVIGRIYKMHQQKKLLNFQFSRYYRGGLSMVIWRNREKEFIAKFGELRSALPGRYVQIKGRITSYRGTPQIIARNPNDISILH